MAGDLATDLLRSFVTISETGSYTRAAEQLHRTQPALSLQIKRLEEQLGTPLFERNGRTITVTEAGQVLLTYARRILSLNEEALAKLSVVETEGVVRIGVLEEVALGPLVELLTKFGRLCTKIRIDLEVATSWELAARIRENKLCLAVANASYTNDAVVPLWQESYVWAVNQAYSFHEAESLPLILFPEHYPCSLRAGALDGLRERGRLWHIAFSSVSLTAEQAAIRAGLGIGMIAQSAVTPDMRVLGPDEGMPALPPVDIALYRGTDATADAVDSLADFLVTNLCA